MLLQPQKMDALKETLDVKLSELQRQKNIFVTKTANFKFAFQKAQMDVERLEGRSLASSFFQVFGKLEEKLDQKRKKVCAAKARLDTAQRELAGIDEGIRNIQSQLLQIRLVEILYQETLKRKGAELRASGTLIADRIFKIEERISALEAQQYEIRETISAGRNARNAADRVLSKLKSAEGWNTWDMLGGGGMITHMAKHSHLDDAQEMISDLQSALRRFKTELADIRITANIQVNIDGFLRFADYFFDGLFADWTVGNKISQSISSVRNIKSEISRTLGKLKELDQAADQEIEKLRQKLDDLIVNA